MNADDVTPKMVIEAVGWLDRSFTDELEFDSADWRGVETDGEVYLEGRIKNPKGEGDLLVAATFKLTELEIERDWDTQDWGDEDEDEDED